MGVYIKNMEIRENCMNCAARHGAECWLADCSYIPNYRKERPKWCPLIPVPPHGRLVDADALVRELNSIRASFGSANGLVEGGLNIAVSTVNGRPTIIPAEEGE